MWANPVLVCAVTSLSSRMFTQSQHIQIRAADFDRPSANPVVWAAVCPKTPGVGQGPSATRPTIWIAITFTMVAEGKIMA
jgi:hypothetical protein